jgi:hypothetical protein
MFRPIIPFMCLGVGFCGIYGIDMIKCYPYESGTPEQQCAFVNCADSQKPNFSAMASNFINGVNGGIQQEEVVVTPTTNRCSYNASECENVDILILDETNGNSLPEMRLSIIKRNDEKIHSMVENGSDHDKIVEIKDAINEIDVSPTEPTTFVEHNTPFTVTNDVVYTHGQINIRYGPSVRWNIVTCIPNGTAILRIGKGAYGWDKIEYDGIIAYAWSQLLHDAPQ